MIERLRRLLREYRDIISSVESMEIRATGKLTILRMKLVLIDGSKVYVREIWRRGRLLDYSYWWLDINDELMEGWDNSPHHPEIKTYPHHKHTPEGVKELHNPSLSNFLETIRKRILQ